MKKPDPRFFKALDQFADTDPIQLSLQASKFPNLDIPFIVQQITARKKAKMKLPEWLAQDRVIFPPTISMEQCSSEITAKFKAKIFHGHSLIDLTGGAGVDTYYLSKGFDQVTYLERNNDLVQLAEYNFDVLGAKHIRCLNIDSLDYIQNLNQLPTHLYIDPARRDQHNMKVHSFKDCEPDVIQLMELLGGSNVRLLIKASPMLDISMGLTQISNVKAVYVVSVKNECKEILFLVDPTYVGETELKTFNWLSTEWQEYSATFESLGGVKEPTGTIGRYLYEPNASLLKSGIYKLLGKSHGVTKLNPNTHLYTSESLIEDFPGRKFEVTWAGPASKKELSSQLVGSKVSVVSRNYPLTVDQIRKKYNLKDGEDYYLFFYRNIKNKPEVAICRKK